MICFFNASDKWFEPEQIVVDNLKRGFGVARPRAEVYFEHERAEKAVGRYPDFNTWLTSVIIILDPIMAA